MTIKDTDELIRDYVTRGSDEAFKELVGRYINLVYSAALRLTGPDSHQVEDIVQTVFADFARKARRLPKGVLLGGWLHRHTCFVASNMLRADLRRQTREKEAMKNLLEEQRSSDSQLSSVLDEAVDKLDPPDRDILLLRYFEEKDLRTVGLHFGVSEDAAQKRVSRAIERLRATLAEQGVAVGAIALVAILGASSSHAAPGSLSAVVGKLALKKLIPASTALFGLSTGFLLKGLGAAAIIALGLFWNWYRPIAAFSKSQAAQRRMQFRSAPKPAVMTSLQSIASSESIVGRPNIDPTNLLTLTIVADDSGQPIPNVPLDYRAWEGTLLTRRQLRADRSGKCEIEFPRANLTELRITTRIDDFADTRLDWKSDNGEIVPAAYTLRLIRPMEISGIVVDEEKHPVEGAKVHFENEECPDLEKNFENHIFGSIEATTDSTGHWRINRIASEMMQLLQGGARHPEYVESGVIRLEYQFALQKELREVTHIFRLSHGASVRGWVAGSDGKPIAAANLLVGMKGEMRSRQSVSESDGSFLVSGCTKGKTTLTAEAQGYAATTVPIEITDSVLPQTIVLRAGKLLRFRVLDLSGSAIPNARFWLNTSTRPHPVSESVVTSIQASFEGVTDAVGRLSWDSAPETDLTFTVRADGFRSLRGFKVHPDELEHDITLKPALVLAGTVKDLLTHENIPHFRIITGWPQPDLIGGFVEPMWSPFDRNWLSFSSGKFRQVFEDHFIGDENSDKDSYVFKFEANGYVPFISRIVEASEGEVSLNVELKPSNAIKVTLLTPMGRPAGNAQIGLGNKIRNRPLGMTDSGFQSQDPDRLLKVDDKGAFSFEPDETTVQIFAFHSEGFAEFAPDTLRDGAALRLEPWGHVDGVVGFHGKSVSSSSISLSRLGADGAGLGISTKAGPDGRFSFPCVPAGRFSLYATPEGDPKLWSEFYQGPLGQIEVHAGEMIHAEY